MHTRMYIYIYIYLHLAIAVSNSSGDMVSAEASTVSRKWT